jgi:hypothetical protein
LSEGAINNAFLSYDDSAGFRINSVDTLALRTNNLDRLGIASNGDISFYEDTGTTAKLTWDASAELLTTTGLDVTGTATMDGLKLEAASPVVEISSTSVSDLASIHFTTSGGAVDSKITHQANTSLMTIDSGRNASWGGKIDFVTDTDRRMRISNNGDISFYEDTGTTAKFFWDASAESLGIGTSLPAGDGTALHIHGSSASTLHLTNSTTGSAISDGFDIVTDGLDALLRNRESGAIKFRIGSSEAMRIDSSGNLLVGTTDNSPVGNNDSNGIALLSNGSGQFSRDGGTALLINRKTSDGELLRFNKDSTSVGSISVSSSATAYNTSSDQRLKDNIVDAPSASDDIDAIQVRSFDWKADGSHQKYGMVAQELNTVAPEAVSGDADSEEMMGVDYSKLVPMLIKEIQSLRNRVAQLEE